MLTAQNYYGKKTYRSNFLLLSVKKGAELGSYTAQNWLIDSLPTRNNKNYYKKIDERKDWIFKKKTDSKKEPAFYIENTEDRNRTDTRW